MTVVTNSEGKYLCQVCSDCGLFACFIYLSCVKSAITRENFYWNVIMEWSQIGTQTVTESEKQKPHINKSICFKSWLVNIGRSWLGNQSSKDSLSVLDVDSRSHRMNPVLMTQLPASDSYCSLADVFGVCLFAFLIRVQSERCWALNVWPDFRSDHQVMVRLGAEARIFCSSLSEGGLYENLSGFFKIGGLSISSCLDLDIFQLL